jgi:hypothetical protein
VFRCLCVCVAWKRVNPSRIMRFLRIFQENSGFVRKKTHMCDFFSQKSMFLAIFWEIWQGRDSHSGLQCRYWSVIYLEDVWLPRCRVSRLVWSSCQALLLVQHIVILQCMEVICCVRRRAAVWIHVGGYGSRNSTFKDRCSRYVGHVLSQGSRLVCSDWSDLLC